MQKMVKLVGGNQNGRLVVDDGRDVMQMPRIYPMPEIRLGEGSQEPSDDYYVVDTYTRRYFITNDGMVQFMALSTFSDLAALRTLIEQHTGMQDNG